MLRTLSTKLFVVVLLCSVYAALSSSVVSAQEDPGLQLRPAIIDVSGLPGESVSTQVTVTNTSAESLGVSVQTRSLAPEDELIDEAARDRYDATRWVSFPKKDFLIDGFDSVDVEVNITVPQEAVPGGRYALASFRLVSDEEPDATGVQINREAGAVMLINVPGETQERLELVEMNSSKIFFGSGYEGSYELLNTGNTHSVPIVKTEIRNDGGEVVDTITQPVRILLPNTKRTIDVSWDDGSSFSSYSARTTVSYGTPAQIITGEQTAFLLLPGLGIIIVWTLVVFVGARVVHRHLLKTNAYYAKQTKRVHELFVKFRRRFVVLIKKVKNTLLSKRKKVEK